MIVKLKGIIDEISNDAVVMDVAGVCYHLTCSTRTLSKLPSIGTACTLQTEMVVREDAMSLFGFIDAQERQWFRLLTSVQGVGKRVALSLLSLAEGSVLAQAIGRQDKAFIARAEGVGPKLAARLVTELKDKVDKITAFFPTDASVHPGMVHSSPQLAVEHDAVAALLALGYRSFEAQAVIQSVMSEMNHDPKVEDLIRMSLAQLGRKA